MILEFLFRNKTWVGTFLGVIFLLVSFQGKSKAAEINDKIHVCDSLGAKLWYFSIGSDVFDIPSSQFLDSTGGPLVDDETPKLMLVPPNPNEAVGCRDNPQQLSRFSVHNRPIFEPPQYRGPLPYSVSLLEMYRYPNISSAKDPKADPEIAELIQTAVICQSKKLVRRWPDGTILCTDKDGQLNTLLSQGQFKFAIGWEYIISGHRYLTPLGQLLTMHEDLNWVDVSYLLTSNVLVHYQWDPPIAAKTIDPDYLVSIDKLFLSKLSSYQVSNYRWPHQPSN